MVDTDVFSARLVPDAPLARRYEPLFVGRVEFVSFQTVAADRWIAATALRLGVPLVSNDSVFRGAPGLELETLTP